VIEHFALVPLAALIGVVLGALGSGGAILALPVLVYVAHLGVREAVGVSQVVVGTAALFGSLLNLRSGRISLRHAFLYSLAGIPAAKLGAWAGRQIDAAWQMLVFGILVGIAGWRMLRPANPRPAERESIAVAILVGAVVGSLTGLLGVGGGFLLVPALIGFGGLDTKRATATSLAIIAANSAVGAWESYALWSREISLVGAFLGSTLLGTFAGLNWARRVSEQKLRTALGWVLVSVGVVVAGRNLLVR
jgi:uncharacterized membrane protein YfcA